MENGHSKNCIPSDYCGPDCHAECNEEIDNLRRQCGKHVRAWTQMNARREAAEAEAKKWKAIHDEHCGVACCDHLNQCPTGYHSAAHENRDCNCASRTASEADDRCYNGNHPSTNGKCDVDGGRK